MSNQTRREEIKKLIFSPNFVTIFRIIVAPIFLFCTINLPKNILFLRWFNGFFFVAIALTDLLDGYLARKSGKISIFGQCFDHIADKILVTLSLLALTFNGTVSVIPVAIIVTRDFVVTGVREFVSLSKGVTVPVSTFSKTKTAIQMTAITLLIIADSTVGFIGLFGIGTVLLWFSALVAVYTMYQHSIVAFKIMKEQDESSNTIQSDSTKVDVEG